MSKMEAKMKREILIFLNPFSSHSLYSTEYGDNNGVDI